MDRTARYWWICPQGTFNGQDFEYWSVYLHLVAMGISLLHLHVCITKARRVGNGGCGYGAVAVTSACLLQRPEEWGTEVVAVGISLLHIGLHVCVTEARRVENGGRGCGDITVTHSPTCLCYRGQKSGERRSWLCGYRCYTCVSVLQGHESGEKRSWLWGYHCYT